jgi:hypothetical protein
MIDGSTNNSIIAYLVIFLMSFVETGLNVSWGGHYLKSKKYVSKYIGCNILVVK